MSFRRFWLGQTLTQAGTRVGTLALSVTAVAVLHADSMQVGLLAACTTASYLVIGLPAGAWVDRVRKRPAMMAAALARALVRMVSAPLVLLVDAAAALACLLCTAGVKDNEVITPPTGRRLGAEITEGLRFIWGQPVIRRLAVSMGVSNLFATLVLTLAPLLVLEVIGFDATMLGLVMTCGAVGGTLGAVLAPFARRYLSAGTAMAGGLVMAALFTASGPVAAAVSPHSRVTAAALLLAGEFGLALGALIYNVTQVSLRQILCPPNLLGRMNASVRFVVRAGMPLAALAAGWLGSSMGVAAAMWVGVVGTTLTVLPILTIDRIIPVEVTGR